MRWIALALLLGATTPAMAKKKPPKTSAEVKKDDGRNHGPGDKGTNEGAQGRQNATEDASKAGEAPIYQR